MNKDTARLTDFENVAEAITWLQGKFTLAEIVEALAEEEFEDEEEED
jgi:hypothetical protein